MPDGSEREPIVSRRNRKSSRASTLAWTAETPGLMKRSTLVLPGGRS